MNSDFSLDKKRVFQTRWRKATIAKDVDAAGTQDLTGEKLDKRKNLIFILLGSQATSRSGRYCVEIEGACK